MKTAFNYLSTKSTLTISIEVVVHFYALLRNSITDLLHMASLSSMVQKQLKNEVPESVLVQCPEADRTIVENVLRLAQVELTVLNLASTTVAVEGRKITLKCALTGPTQTVSLSSMRSLQAYSPARVLEIRAVLADGSMLLVIDLSDATARISTSELEIVRITKKRRLIDRLFNTV